MNKPNMLTLDADALAERVNECEHIASVKGNRCFVCGAKVDPEPTITERIAELEARLKEAEGALKKVEWIRSGIASVHCPWCRGYQDTGHKPDCARQAALSHAEQDGGKDQAGDDAEREEVEG